MDRGCAIVMGFVQRCEYRSLQRDWHRHCLKQFIILVLEEEEEEEEDDIISDIYMHMLWMVVVVLQLEPGSSCAAKRKKDARVQFFYSFLC